MDGGFLAQPITADGRVFVTAPRRVIDFAAEDRERRAGAPRRQAPEWEQGGVHCLDALTGELIWRNALTGRYNSNMGTVIGSPAIYGDKLYCQFDLGPVWALPKDTGADEDAYTVADCGQRDDEPSPTIDLGCIIEPGEDSIQVWTLDANVHSAEVPIKDRILGSVAVGQGRLHFVGIEGIGNLPWPKLSAVAPHYATYPSDLANALEAMDWDLEHTFTSRGCVAGHGYFAARVKVGTAWSEGPRHWILCGKSGARPRVTWSVSSAPGELGELALTAEMVLFGDSAGVVHAVDLKSGHERWTVRSSDGAPVLAPPLALGELILFGSTAGTLTAVDSSNGSLVWDMRVPGGITASPTTIDGWVFLSTDRGLSAYTIH